MTLDGVSDDATDEGSELEAVSTPSRRDDEPVPVGIPIDEKVAIEAVAVQAHPRSDYGSVGQRREGFGQEGSGT